MKKYPFLKTIKRSIHEVWKKEKIIFVLFFIYTLIASIIPLLSIYMPRMILEEIQKIEIYIPNLLKIVGGFTILIGVFGFFERYIFNTIYVRTMKIRIDLLTDIFDKTNRLDYKHTEDPDFENENNDAYNVIGGSDYEEYIRKLFVVGSRLVLSLIYIYILSLLHYLVIIAILISLGFSIFSAFIIKDINFKQKKKFAAARRRINYYEKIMQDFNYGKDIRLYNFSNSITDSYNFEIKSYVSILRKVKNKEYLLALFDAVFVLISDSVLYYFLITSVLNQGLNIAMFSFYLLAALALSTIFKLIVEDIIFLIAKGQYLNDYFVFMDTEFNEIKAGITELEAQTLEIEFKNVSFKYPKTDKWIIRNLNLKIKMGEKLAIVGINGAGKTTIVKLLLRLFLPTEGVILVNSIDARDYDKDTYQGLFAPVFQDVNILSFSIRENITLGLSNDEEKIWKCLDLVGLGTKVRSLEKGIDTILLKNIDENGIILSGGENQKLAIARALYKNSKMVVLDEPTASLDALAEAEIYENFNKLVEKHTTIFISHRLASTKFCDKIALFNNAGLEEYGNHDELMAKKGEYYKMFIIQGKYYQNGDNHEGI